MSSLNRSQFANFKKTEDNFCTRRKTKFMANPRASMLLYKKKGKYEENCPNSREKVHGSDMLTEQTEKLKALRNSRFLNTTGHSS